MGFKESIDNLLEQDIRYLKGVGPKKSISLHRLGVKTVRDLFFLLPKRYEDRKNIVAIKDIMVGETFTIQGTITLKGRRRIFGKKGFGIIVDDGTSWVEVIFLVPSMFSHFKLGEKIILTGKVSYDRYYKKKIIIHPEYAILGKSEREELVAGLIVPVYPQTEGIDSKFIRKLVYDLLRHVPDFEDVVPVELRKKRGLLEFKDAIAKIHFPDTLEEAKAARKTLSYHELFDFFYRLKAISDRKNNGVVFGHKRHLSSKFIKNLPFKLTGAQKKVIGEIDRDLMGASPMRRLLQGDVGSGKTVVALYAMLRSVESGYQAAYMAPTESLSEQVYIVVTNFLRDIPVSVKLLTGKTSLSEKKAITKDLRENKIDIVIGTHAVIQKDVDFSRLGIAIVDEQHRFGVVQRQKILKKSGEKVANFLLMTATPIPRSLALTLYGDLELSIIDEMPPGRRNINTSLKFEDQRESLYKWVFSKVDRENLAYVVAPVIEKTDFSEEMGIRPVVELFDYLTKIKPDAVSIGLLHGRMKTEEKRKAMQKFRDGEYNVLVSTTVIEVGIDVSNAIIMVIEHADRFGLAQLHQLRGRVGRSDKKSYCVLVTSGKTQDTSIARLKSFAAISDGFKLAEEDLKMRGPGEFLGTRQHGYTGFKAVDFYRDRDIIAWARSDVNDVKAARIAVTEKEKKLLLDLLSKMNEEDSYVA